MLVAHLALGFFAQPSTARRRAPARSRATVTLGPFAAFDRWYREHSLRNRWSRDWPAVFQMDHAGLLEVTNPSKLLLAGRSHDAIGSCIFAGVEGSRPMLAEIQALTAPSPFGTPRRSVIGLDGNRLAMILAVLEARCNISLSNKDIFLNVVGGLKISEPAADLAVAAALLSSLFNFPVPQESVIFGEIGLSAEIRTVNNSDIRLKEGFKLGFTKAIISPISSINLKSFAGLEMNIKEVSSLHDLVTIFENPNTLFDASNKNKS